jgi:hypothetical protein
MPDFLVQSFLITSCSTLQDSSGQWWVGAMKKAGWFSSDHPVILWSELQPRSWRTFGASAVAIFGRWHEPRMEDWLFQRGLWWSKKPHGWTNFKSEHSTDIVHVKYLPSATCHLQMFISFQPDPLWSSTFAACHRVQAPMWAPNLGGFEHCWESCFQHP